MRGLLHFVFGAISLGAASMMLSASPVSSCVPNMGPGFTCNMYETDSMGNPSDISSVTLPSSVTTGFIALIINPGGSDTDPTNWSNVLDFPDAGGGMATMANYYTQGCNVAAGDTSCFPSLAEPHTFINEDPSGTTTWTSGPNTYLLHTDSFATPEPTTISLFGLSLVGIGFIGRKKFVK